jgi:hypothetical protein
MSLWTLNQPPKFKNPKGKELVASAKGWEDPETGEVLVAIKTLSTKAGAADVMAAVFSSMSLEQGDAFSVTVRFNEKVTVTAGANIECSWSGVGGNFYAHAVAQTNVNEVVFAKQANLLDDVVVPSEAGTLSLAGQTLSGTVVDLGTVVSSNLVLSGPAAAAAGSVVVA